MRLFTRMLVCVATAMVLCAALLGFVGSWFGEDTSLLRLSRSLLFETHRGELLRDRAEVLSECMESKKEITDQVLAGRLHLREAIAEFQKVNERIENVDLYLVPEYRKPSDPEGVGRQVIAWVKGEVASLPPDRDKRIVQVVEKEFQELFGVPYSQRSDGRNREPSEVRGLGSARVTY